MQRDSFNSRLGFLLVSAGCAIGIGNVWRFPFVAGENGGGIFVLFYLLFLILMGAPVLTMELAMGRASRQTIVNGYKALEPAGTKWHWHGMIAIMGNYLLMMYYTTVSGWMSSYLFKFLNGEFGAGMDKNAVDGVFASLLANPVQLGLWTSGTIILAFLVLSFGIQKGLERVTKYMMGALFVLILVLALHSFTLPNAAEGMRFYLMPDWSKVEHIGLLNVVVSAMNQAFFTLSIGMASMEIFGSYMSREFTLGDESLRICTMDTFVAIMAGTIIFPACFAFGINPDAGPSLIFITLPNVFINMSGGMIWGALFFLFMTFASLSTVLGVCENVNSFCIDTFGWSRSKAVVVNGLFILVMSIPCVLGFNVLSDVHLFRGMDVLSFEDFLVSTLLLPIGSLLFLIFCTWKFGWGFDNFMKEANSGTGVKIPYGMKPYFKYVLPVLIGFIIINGLRNI